MRVFFSPRPREVLTLLSKSWTSQIYYTGHSFGLIIAVSSSNSIARLLATTRLSGSSCQAGNVTRPVPYQSVSQNVSGTLGVFAFSLPTYTQSINCACTSARGWSPDQRRLSTRHRMRYTNREAAFVAVAASAIVAACEDLNRSSRVDDAASCIILWLYLPVSSRARMPSVKMTIFGFRMKMAWASVTHGRFCCCTPAIFSAMNPS